MENNSRKSFQNKTKHKLNRMKNINVITKDQTIKLISPHKGIATVHHEL